MSEVKAIKVINPLFVGQLGPKIQDFVNRIAPIGITYETMYAYLAQIAQFGGDNSELWLAQNETENLAFATWHVKQLPHMGKVRLDFVHNWSKRSDAMTVLIEEFSKFGLRHNAPIYVVDTRIAAIAELTRKYAEKQEYEILEDGNLTRMIIRKKAK